MKKMITALMIVVFCFSTSPFKIGKAEFNKYQTNRFSEDLRSDPFLKSLVELSFYANKISTSDPVLMGEYLKTTPWYVDEIARLNNDKKLVSNLDASLKHLDLYSNAWPNQKIQCVGLSVLIGRMDKRFVNTDIPNITIAADYVPDSIRNGKVLMINGNGMVIMVVESLFDVQVGDFGVRYDSSMGHIFAVVGKKIIDEEVVLLVVSANKDKDGKIELFEVDKTNFDEIFGDCGTKKVVLRSTKSEIKITRRLD